jgi:molybdenum ABC transporter ATP-binding protein
MLTLDVRLIQGSFTLDVATRVEARVTALVGPSGAGKTTLLEAIAGLRRPGRGEIRVADHVLYSSRDGVDLPPYRRHVGYVPQDVALFPHMNVRRNLLYGASRNGSVTAGLPLDRITRMLEIEPLIDRGVRDLSGGERQRVALARALAPGPDVLLLDEPLSALDARTRAAAGRELAAVLQAAGVPALLVTHDFQEAALLGDRVGVMDGGRIVQTGSASELAAEPASPFVADFTGAVVLTGTASPGAGGLTRVALDGGGEVSSPDAGEGPVAVTVFPWDIALAPPGAVDPGSARNHLAVAVVSVTAVGNRVRVGLTAPQPLTAELTAPAVERLHIQPGARLVASWKATATKLLPL